MTSIVRWASDSLSNALGVNSATLSGAIDVIVVEQAGGDLESSPFHVRFGKLQLLKSRGEIVHIRVNGAETPLKMRLGSAGEAFFVERVDQEERLDEVVPVTDSIIEDEAESLLAEQALMRQEDLKHEVGVTRDQTEKEAAETETPAKEDRQEAPGTPPEERILDQNNEIAPESSAKRELSALLPKWYTTLPSEHADAVLAALEDREQRLERRQDSVEDPGHDTASVTSSAIDSSNEVDDEAVNETGTERADEEKKERSWIWSYGSLPRRLLAGSSRSQDEADDSKDREEVRAVLDDLLLRIVQQEEPPKVGPARHFVRMLWRRGRSSRDTDQDDLGQQQSSPLTANTSTVEPLQEDKSTLQQQLVDDVLADEETALITQDEPCVPNKDNEAESIKEVIHSLPSQSKSALPTIEEPAASLVLAGEDGDPAEIVDAARFRSESSRLLLDPRLRIRLEGRYVDLAVALPALVSRYCFANDDEDNASLEPTPLQSSPKLFTTNSSSSVLELELLLSNRSCESLAALREDAAVEELRAELTSSDNLAALVALDQINPDLSHSNLAALARSVGMPLDGGHNSSSTLADTDASALTFELPQAALHTYPDSSSSGHGQQLQNDVSVEQVIENQENLLIEDDSTQHQGAHEDKENDTVHLAASGYSTTKSTNQQDSKEEEGGHTPRKSGRKKFPYRKTLRPSQRQLASLGLRRGANTIEFYVVKAKARTELVVTATAYRWPWRAKCVFADIDGVIAQSGSAPLQLLGRRTGNAAAAESRSDVAEFFTNVSKHGYRIVYLTTRAIGVASATREALQQRWDGDVSLPRAPVLLAPGSLLDSAYYSSDFDATRFKDAALRSVLALFPGRRPLWAALAREKDNVSPYLEAGIPRGRVFRIYPDDNDRVLGAFDASGAVISSYKRLNSLIDQTFPPFDDSYDISGTWNSSRHDNELRNGRFLSCVDDNLDDQYNDLNFWKVPLPSLSPASPPKLGRRGSSVHASPSVASVRRPRASSEGGISWAGLQLPKFRSTPSHSSQTTKSSPTNQEIQSHNATTEQPSTEEDTTAAAAAVLHGGDKPADVNESALPVPVTPPALLVNAVTSSSSTPNVLHAANNNEEEEYTDSNGSSAAEATQQASTSAEAVASQ